MKLSEMVKDPDLLRKIAADGARLVDEEVARRSGITGMAIRTGYKAMQKVKPGIVEEAMGFLLPGFAPAVDPFWERAKSSGEPHRFFTEHADAIAAALLAVTDRRAESSRHAVLKKVYLGLRGMALAQTAASVPQLANLILKYDPL